MTSLLRSSPANTGMRAVVSSPTTMSGPVSLCILAARQRLWSQLAPQSLHHNHCAQALKHGCANRDRAASDTATATTSSTAWDCDPSPVLLARRGIVERDPSPCVVLSSQAQVQPRPQHAGRPITAPCLRSKRQSTWFCASSRAPCVSHSGAPAALPTVNYRNVTAQKVFHRLAESQFVLVLQ